MLDTTTIAAAPVTKLIDEFRKLPGVGPKSAQRMAYYVMRVSDDEARALSAAILDVKERIGRCSVCQNLTDSDPCTICRSTVRDRSIICVVEEPLDILTLERTGIFKGLYHVLNGVLSPLDGVSEEDLTVRELLARLSEGEVREVIMAINPNLQGDMTAQRLEQLITPLNVRVTRLARGLPVGADIGYADEVTLTRSLEGRTSLS